MKTGAPNITRMQGAPCLFFQNDLHSADLIALRQHNFNAVRMRGAVGQNTFDVTACQLARWLVFFQYNIHQCADFDICPDLSVHNFLRSNFMYFVKNFSLFPRFPDIRLIADCSLLAVTHNRCFEKLGVLQQLFNFVTFIRQIVDKRSI